MNLVNYALLLTVILIFPLSLYTQNNDCIEAQIICSDGTINFTPSGPGNDDFAPAGNNSGCLFVENQSAWYYFEFSTSMPGPGIITFTITPNGGTGEDYDFAIYGPDVGCDNLGSPVRCSWATEFCAFCPQTGLGNGATEASEGSGGDGFVSPMIVQPGQGFYLLVDNWLGNSNGFQLDWGGSAAPFLECVPSCGMMVDIGPDITTCIGSDPFNLIPSISGVSASATYTWTATNGGENYLSSTSDVNTMVTLPGGFVGNITYMLTVIDGNCQVTGQVNVSVNPDITVSINGDDTYCEGGSTVLDAGPGFASYAWSGSGDSQTVNVSTPGIHTVTVTDNSGCSGEASITVTELPAPTPVISGDLSVCSGGSTLLDAGDGYDTYIWQDGSTDQTFDADATGTYSVTVTDGSACAGNTSVDVNLAPPPTVNISGDLSICEAETTTLDAGSGFVSYSWSNNTSLQTITVGSADTYTVTVEDSDGCEAIASVDVSVSPLPSPNISGDLDMCVGGGTLLDASGSYVSYLWSNNEPTPSISVDAPGNYSVTVTDSEGCEGVTDVDVVEVPNPVPSISGDLTICPGETSILDAGTGFDAYEWSGLEDSQTINVTSAGTYSVTVLDNNSCEGSATVNVTENPVPTPTISGLTDICPGQNTLLDAGVGFNSYEWSDGTLTQILSTNIPGDYTVTVTNLQQCSGVATVTVTESSLSQPSISGVLSFCAGNGTTLDAGPGYHTYLWSDNTNGQQINIIAPGNIGVTVTNSAGCEAFASVMVAEIPLPDPTIDGDLSFCEGAGTILDAGPGYASYDWSVAGGGQTISIANPGVVEVTVTNAEGCSASTSAMVNSYDNPEAAIVGDLSYCEGFATTLDAGIGYTSYMWSNGLISQSIPIAEPGNIGVTVTDINGCSGATTAFITENPSPVPTVASIVQFCPGDTVELDAGAGFNSYTWSNSLTDQVIQVSEEGMISIIVEDDNDCLGVVDVNISHFPEPSVDILGLAEFCGQDSIALDAGAGFAEYEWGNGSSNQIFYATQEGEYRVTITDTNGCEATDTHSLDPIAPLSLEITGVTSFCNGSSTLLDAGPGYDSYLWSDGSINQTLLVDEPGNIGVTVTQAGGCIAEDAVLVEELTTPTPQITGILNYCAGFFTTLALDEEYTHYQWSNSTQDSVLYVNLPGNYSVTVTDQNGCSGTTTEAVQEVDTLEPLILGDQSFCIGSSVTLQGESGYATYNWSTGDVGTTANVDEPGVVTLSVTDANGCSGSSTLSITENEVPTTSISGTDYFCTGTSTPLDAGAGFVSYNWSNGDSTQLIEANTAENYLVVVTDANGCTGAASLDISETSLPEPEIEGNLNFCPGASTTLSLTEVYVNYQWSDGSENPVFETDTLGTYEITVTNEFGCAGSASVEVTAYTVSDPIISGNLIFCPGDSTQLQTTDGFVNYEWSDNTIGQTINITQAGTYSLSVTDNNGCETSSDVIVAEQVVTPLNIVGETDFCSGGLTLLDAGSGYQSYVWSDDQIGQAIAVDSGGEYSVTVIDENGCQLSSVVDVIEYSIPEVTIGGSSSFCIGGNTMLNAGATYTDYQWEGGSADSVLMVSSAGIYSLTVTDEHGCEGTATVEVTEDTELSPVITGDFEYCENGSTIIDAGSGFDQYTWSDSSSGQTLEVDEPGLYGVTVTDGGGCMGDTAIMIIENPLPVHTIVGVSAFCEGSSTTLEGGADFVDYLWSNNENDSIVNISEPGPLALLVTDANGCSAETSVVVEEQPLPQFEISGQDFFCEGSTTILTTTPGFADYEWSSGQDTHEAIINLSGTHSLTVTNEFGCQKIQQIDIEEINLPSADAGQDLILTCDQNTVILGSSNSSQGNELLYIWSGPDIDANNQYLAFPAIDLPGIYQLTITDTLHNCVSVTVAVNVEESIEDPPVVLQVLDVLDCITTTVVIDGTLSASGEEITYQWYDSNGSMIQNATDNMLETNTPATYFLLVTDTLTGCSAMGSVEVNEDIQYPLASAGDPQHLDCDEANISLDGSGSEAGSAISYSWSTTDGFIVSGGSGISPVVSEPGLYILSVMDSLNGCTNQDTVLVSQDANVPVANAGADQYLDCIDKEVILDGSGSSAANDFKIEWSLNEGPYFNQNELITVDQPGIYTLTITDLVNGCKDTDVVVISGNNDSPSELILAINGPGCSGENNGSIAIESVLGGTPPYVYSINEDAFGSINVFEQLSPGEYTLTVQDAEGCEVTLDTLLGGGGELDIDLGEDIYINLGETARINADITVPYDYLKDFRWESLDSLGCDNCPSIEVKPMETTSYLAIVEDENGCLATDELIVFVDRKYEVFIPNAFSPNGDGNNDIFTIFAGEEVKLVKSLMIFDRWGENIFKASDFSPNDPTYGWNGKRHSQILNAGVFTYFAEVEFLNGEVVLFKGDVTLMK